MEKVGETGEVARWERWVTEVRWQGGWLADNCVASLLVGCCDWVVNQDGVCIEVCWGSAVCEGRPGCGQLEQKPDGQGASMEAEWATSHG